jgi:hypothetical protein
MVNQVLWWCNIALECLLIVRGIRGKLAARYQVFYSYVSFVLFQELLRFATYQWHQQLYRNVYWTTEFLAVMLGCAVVFEIYRVGLSAYPGAARMARNALALVFALALAKALANTANDPRWWVDATYRSIEGTLRTVQAVAIIALVALFLFYSIPFGRNLRGILLGYGAFIAVSVVSLTLSRAGASMPEDIWSYVFPASFLIALCLWATHLWSYSPNPVPKRAVRLEQEYLRVAAATRRRLQDARGYLARVVRP